MSSDAAHQSLPLVSVVVATIGRPDLLVRCLEGIVAGDLDAFEVVVVDQSSDGRTRQAVDDHFGAQSRVRYLHSEVTGLSHARNLGVKEARGAIVAFLDDDAVPGATWLAAIVSAFREVRPSPGIVSGPILPDWEAPCPAWYPREYRYLLGLYDLGPEAQPFPPGDFPPGANMALRRDVLAVVGGFDSRLGFDSGRRSSLVAGDDTHVALKTLQAGHVIWYEPRAGVRHRIARYKVTSRYLLRRLFSEGRTFVRVRRLVRRERPTRSWLVMWADSRRKARLHAASGAGSLVEWLASRPLFVVGLGAAALGAIAEVLARLGRREPGDTS